MHKDLYRARAAALSMIPTSTGAAKAVGLVCRSSRASSTASSIRVPTPNVSVVDFKFVAKKRDQRRGGQRGDRRRRRRGPLKGILGYHRRAAVCRDFNHDPHSSIFAFDQTKVIDEKFVRVLSWYDNEWGFSNRMADTAVAMAQADLSRCL